MTAPRPLNDGRSADFDEWSRALPLAVCKHFNHWLWRNGARPEVDR